MSNHLVEASNRPLKAGGCLIQFNGNGFEWNLKMWLYKTGGCLTEVTTNTCCTVQSKLNEQYDLYHVLTHFVNHTVKSITVIYHSAVLSTIASSHKKQLFVTNIFLVIFTMLFKNKYYCYLIDHSAQCIFIYQILSVTC